MRRGFDWILASAWGISYKSFSTSGEIETKTYISQVQVHVNHKQFDKLKVSLILTWVVERELQFDTIPIYNILGQLIWFWLDIKYYCLLLGSVLSLTSGLYLKQIHMSWAILQARPSRQAKPFQ